MKNRKVIIIGLDGATFDLIKPWTKEGKLPNFEKLIKEGCHGELESTIPHVTPPAWTSITTGKNPAKHGIFEFMGMERTDDEWEFRLYTSKNKKTKEIWDYLGNKKSIVINLPLTYPPYKINGLMVTGMLTPDTDSNFTYPKELKKEILKLFPSYRIELNWNEYKGKKQKFLKDLYKMTEERIKLFWHFFKMDWQFFFFVFVGTDRIQHIIWDDNELLKYYMYIDKFVGELIKKINNENTYLFLVSDHGFSKVKKEVYINTFFVQEGYLSLKIKHGRIVHRVGISREALSELVVKSGLNRFYIKLPPKILNFIRKNLPGKSNPVYDFDLKISKAVMMGMGNIYITKENNGLKEEIIKKLENLKDPDTGERVIEKVFKKEEIYRGRFINKAPDLIILPKKGYSLIYKLSDVPIKNPQFKKADHALNGIFLAYGPDIKHGIMIENAKIYDIAPTILHIFGLPISKDIDGKVLKEIFEGNSEFAKRKLKYVDPSYSERNQEDEKLKRAIRKLNLKGKIK